MPPWTPRPRETSLSLWPPIDQASAAMDRAKGVSRPLEPACRPRLRPDRTVVNPALTQPEVLWKFREGGLVWRGAAAAKTRQRTVIFTVRFSPAGSRRHPPDRRQTHGQSVAAIVRSSLLHVRDPPLPHRPAGRRPAPRAARQDRLQHQPDRLPPQRRTPRRPVEGTIEEALRDLPELRLVCLQALGKEPRRGSTRGRGLTVRRSNLASTVLLVGNERISLSGNPQNAHCLALSFSRTIQLTSSRCLDLSISTTIVRALLKSPSQPLERCTILTLSPAQSRHVDMYTTTHSLRSPQALKVSL